MITKFDGPHGFLSNFHPAVINYRGHLVTTAEHAYQLAKCKLPSDAASVAKAHSPAMAKALARMCQKVDNWDNIKDGVMLEVLRLKFNNAWLRECLLKTCGEVLIEGNTWGDRYWGVCYDYKNPDHMVGNNKLGLLLMQVREECSNANQS